MTLPAYGTPEAAEQLAASLDAQLLEQLSNGVIVIDGKGAAVMGSDGKPLRRQPSAALLVAAQRRLAMMERDSRTRPRHPIEMILAEQARRATAAPTPIASTAETPDNDDGEKARKLVALQERLAKAIADRDGDRGKA